MSEGLSGRSYDRRRWLRVKLTVPVCVTREGSGKGGVVPFSGAQSVDLSAGGAYLTMAEGGRPALGAVLSLEIPIPWEFRGKFPFSRIVASARVVRVEADPQSARQGEARGIALAFCEHRLTMLGAIVAPSR